MGINIRNIQGRTNTPTIFNFRLDIFNINNDDPMEIFTDGDTIIFKQFKTACIFCDSRDDLEVFKDKSVCPKCFKDLESKHKKTP